MKKLIVNIGHSYRSSGTRASSIIGDDRGDQSHIRACTISDSVTVEGCQLSSQSLVEDPSVILHLIALIAIGMSKRIFLQDQLASEIQKTVHIQSCASSIYNKSTESRDNLFCSYLPQKLDDTSFINFFDLSKHKTPFLLRQID